jgi:transposase-like protein
MRNSMMQQRRFTKEFEEEAVRLVQTSGRTQREIAAIWGSGCRRWSAGSAGAGIGVVEQFEEAVESSEPPTVTALASAPEAARSQEIGGRHSANKLLLAWCRGHGDFADQAAAHGESLFVTGRPTR